MMLVFIASRLVETLLYLTVALLVIILQREQPRYAPLLIVLLLIGLYITTAILWIATIPGLWQLIQSIFLPQTPFS